MARKIAGENEEKNNNHVEKNDLSIRDTLFSLLTN